MGGWYTLKWPADAGDVPQATNTNQTENISTTGNRFEAFISRKDKFERMLDTNGSFLSTVSTKRL